MCGRLTYSKNVNSIDDIGFEKYLTKSRFKFARGKIIKNSVAALSSEHTQILLFLVNGTVSRFRQAMLRLQKGDKNLFWLYWQFVTVFCMLFVFNVFLPFLCPFLPRGWWVNNKPRKLNKFELDLAKLNCKEREKQNS